MLVEEQTMFSKKLARTFKAGKGLHVMYSTLLMFWVGDVLAGSAQSLSDIVSNVQGNIITLGPLLTIVSYIAGVGFAIAGIVKFKAHKDNPTQVALSQPIVYICVGAGLLFLPSIMSSAGTTVFGGSQVSAGKGATGLQ